LIAGLEKKRVMSRKEREIVAVPRVGARDRRDGNPGEWIRSTRSRSCSADSVALGYTMQLPLEDRYLMQRKDLLAQLAVLLGGRTAEEIALGEISTARRTICSARPDIARAMVTEWGMSDSLGAINYDGHKRNKFLDIQLGPSAARTPRTLRA
jgi:cell division protease FtsH